MPEAIHTLFVVDDEQVAREGVALALRKHYRVTTFPAAEPALRAMDKNLPDLVLLDIGLPGMNGIEALEKIKSSHPQVMVVMITAYEDVKTVVSAMKSGAYDYVVKPLNMDGLLVTVANAIENAELKREVRTLHERYLKENSPCFIGASDAVQDIMEIVDKVAKSPDTPVQIIGETGTGKELIARAIHYRSDNSKYALVTVNCAAIPNELIESELFGYEKGAFSGADSSGKAGLVEKADQGALFLDEVGDLSLEAQAKILRFLEEGEFYRVGGTAKHRVKTRIISATNRDLERMVDEGAFRQDLYYRLAVVRIEAPSLNERPDDVELIAEYFLEQFRQKFGRPELTLSESSKTGLKNHQWKGNVRELKNRIERAALVCNNPDISPADMGFDEGRFEAARVDGNAPILPVFSTDGVDLPGVLRGVERHYIETALREAGDNESLAARYLGLTRDMLRYRRKQQG